MGVNPKIRGQKSKTLMNNGGHVSCSGCSSPRGMSLTDPSELSSATTDMSQESPHELGASPSTQSTQSPSQDMSSHSQSKPRSQSSSSSGPTSSSQSSSGSGTLSSVDTIPVTLPSVPEEPEAEPWGRLLPMARGFRSHGQ